MEKFDDIMLDIECLGKTGNFMVTQVALVPFNLFGEISQSPLHIRFSAVDLINKGFTMDDDTVRWWIRTSPEGFARQFTGRIPLEKGVERIAKFCKQVRPKRYWASADLDWMALKLLYEERGLDSPINYSQKLNTRTIKEMAQYLLCEPYDKPVVTHDPIQDCIDQIHELNYYMEYLKRKDVTMEL